MDSPGDQLRVDASRDLLIRVRDEIRRTVVGQGEVVDDLLCALAAGGHVLLEGVPGIAKTLLIRTLAATLDASFVRLQFTPDLLPADIIGTRIYRQHDGSFATMKGPIFHQVVLADEINRAPPKVQSALLEAMQERQVTIQGETHVLPDPFFVLATQNPIESEGTYSLPEAQVDRFMVKLVMTYPALDEEVAILDRFAEGEAIEPRRVASASSIAGLREVVREVRAEPTVKRYAAALVDATRRPALYGLDLEDAIAYGGSPRATIGLLLMAKAHAVLEGRAYVAPHDLKAVAAAVLRHRIIRTIDAEADGISTESMIAAITDRIPVP
ncbi:MAG: AAA family ATPase [Methanospirillum sp.]